MAEIDKTPSSRSTNNINGIVMIEGCRLIKSLTHVDSRGTFKKILPLGRDGDLIEFSTCQVNLSTNNSAGTVRGLHYQVSPYLEAKLISCVRGSVLDVLLDMRPSSKTYGRYARYELDPSSGSLLVPPLVAHGYQSLEDETILLYLHSNEYKSDSSQGVNPLDPDLAINWPLPISSISDADRNLPLLVEVKN